MEKKEGKSQFSSPQFGAAALLIAAGVSGDSDSSFPGGGAKCGQARLLPHFVMARPGTWQSFLLPCCECGVWITRVRHNLDSGKSTNTESGRAHEKLFALEVSECGQSSLLIRQKVSLEMMSQPLWFDICLTGEGEKNKKK